MTLKPLHFHGMQDYSTHCMRFVIEKRGTAWGVSSWSIHSHTLGWARWLQMTGLGVHDFKTRRETLAALSDTLEADGLLTERSPAAVVS